MSKLGDVVDQKKRRRFTDRDDEVRLFSRLLDHTFPEYHVLAVHGVGGVGKSTLLNEFAQMCCDRTVPIARVDGAVPQTVIKVTRTIRRQLSDRRWLNPFRQFDRDIRKYLEIQSKIDSSELTQQISEVLSSIGSVVDPTGIYDKLGKETLRTGLSALFSFLSRPEVDFYIQADVLLARRLTEGLARAEPGKLVIMFDAHERLPSKVQDWIVQSFAPNLGEQAILVIASRPRLSGLWADWEATGILRQIELLDFDKSATRKMLARRDIAEESLVDEVFTFTRGHPLCIALVAEIGVELDKRFLVMRSLVERVLDQVTDPRLMDLLRLCAVPRYFNQDIVDYLAGEVSDLEKDVTRLEDYSFVTSVEHGYVMHEAVRDYLVARLARRSPARYRELNERALSYFRRGLTQAYSAERPEFALDAAYHQLNLSEQDGVQYCIDLFAVANSTLDLPLAASVIRELERFRFQDPSKRQWSQALKARYAYLQRDWPQAAEEYRVLLDRAIEPELKLVASNGLARVYVVMNRLDEALFYGENGLNLAQELSHEEGLLDALYNIALVKQRQGHFQQGVELLEGRISESIPDYRRAILLDMLGLLYRSQGELDRAIKCHERSRVIWEELGSQYGIAAVKYLMAAILCKQDYWVQAIAQLEEALQTFEHLGDNAWIARCLSLIGEARIGTGNLDEAIISLTQGSIPIREALGDAYGLILDCAILASIYAERQEYDKALSYYERSLVLSREGGNRAGEARVLLNIASVYLEMRDTTKALEYAQSAVGIAREINLGDLLTEALDLSRQIQEDE